MPFRLLVLFCLVVTALRAVDSGGLTAEIGTVTSPRSTAVALLTVYFSDDVSGVDLADFRLERNGVPIDLSGVTIEYKQENRVRLDLSAVSALPGAYRLTLAADGSGIVDADGGSLLDDATVSWVMEDGRPYAVIGSIASPRNSAVGLVDLQFNEGVSGVDLGDLVLRRDGVPQPWGAVTLSAVTSTRYQVDLTTLTAADGQWSLELIATGSGIAALDDGVSLAVDARADWLTSGIGGGGAGAPTVAFATVASPRTTPIASLGVIFSEGVVGVDLGDFVLERDGRQVYLSGQGLVEVDHGLGVWVLDLSGVTAEDGAYVLRLIAPASGIADDGGDGLASGATVSWVMETGPPLAAFADLGADPRSTAVEVVVLRFDESVSGVDVADLSLTRDGLAVPLTGLAFDPAGPRIFGLSLAGLTDQQGSYTVRLTATGAGISDGQGNALTSDAVLSWVCDQTPPQASFIPVDPDPRQQAVGIVSLAFDGPVSGVDRDDYELRRNGIVVPLDSAAFTAVSSTYYQLDCSAVSDQAGTYSLRLIAAGSGITDSAGNAMVDDAIETWAHSGSVNLAPTIDQPADLVIAEDDGQQTITLSGIGSGGDSGQAITIAATVSDSTLLTPATVTYSSPASTALLRFTPRPDAHGSCDVLLTVSDDGGTANGGVDRILVAFTVTVAAVPDQPVITSQTPVLAQAGSPAPVFASHLAASDVDGDGPAQLVYSLVGVPAVAELRLNGIALTSGGQFSQADINAGLLTILVPGTAAATDQIALSLSDGVTAAVPVQLDVTALSSAGNSQSPVLSLGGVTATYIEGQAPQTIDALMSVDDPEDSYANGLVVASFLAGHEASDRLVVLPVGDLSIDGSSISQAGTPIGSLSGGSNGQPLSVALLPAADDAAVTALLQGIAFISDSAAPGEQDRRIQIVVDDGNGGASTPATITIRVRGVNSAPSVTLPAVAMAYLEGSGSRRLDAAAVVSDVDSADADGGSLICSLIAGAGPGDRLSLLDAGVADGEISHSGGIVRFEGVVIGSLSGNQSQSVRIDCNAACDATALTALARHLVFRNDADQPQEQARQVRIDCDDGDGAVGSGLFSVVVVATNDDPLLQIEASDLAFEEGDAPRLLSPLGQVSDVDSSDFAGGQLRIRISDGLGPADRLLVLEDPAIDLTVAGNVVRVAGVDVALRSGGRDGDPLSLAWESGVGVDTVQAVLRRVAFANDSLAPLAGARTLRFDCSDGDGGATSASRRLLVTDSNSPPSVSIDGGSLTVVEDVAPVFLTSTAAVSDPDSADFIGGQILIEAEDPTAPCRFDLAAQGDAAGEVGLSSDALRYSGQAIGSISQRGATLRISLTDNANAQAVAAVIARVTVVVEDDDPGPGPYVVRVICDDGDGDASPAAYRAIDVTPVNDAPTVAALTLCSAPGIGRTVTLTADDPEGQPVTFSLIDAPSDGSLTIVGDQLIWQPADRTVTGATCQYRADDGAASGAPAALTVLTTAVDAARPRFISLAPTEARVGLPFSYAIQVDVSELGTAPALSWQLVGSVPAGMSLTATGATSARIDWDPTLQADEHLRCGVLVIDGTSQRCSLQPLVLLVRDAPVGGG